MDHNKPVIIGKLELESIPLDEMNVGELDLAKKVGFCTIEVWPNEGPIPHLHIIPIDPKAHKKWECCLCLYKPAYFSHSSKQGTLNSGQKKLIDDWLRESYTINKFTGTRWEWACAIWKLQGNPMINVPTNPNVLQPDYANM